MWAGAAYLGGVVPKDMGLPKARSSPAASQRPGVVGVSEARPAAPALLGHTKRGRKRLVGKTAGEGALSKRSRVEAPAAEASAVHALPKPAARVSNRSRVEAPAAEAPAVPALPKPAAGRGSAAPLGQAEAPTSPKVAAARDVSAVPERARAAKHSLLTEPSFAERAKWDKASEDVRRLIRNHHAFGNRGRGAAQAAEILHAHLENREVPQWQPVLQPLEQLKHAFRSFMALFQEQDNQACEDAAVTPKQWLQVSHQVLVLYHMAEGVLDQDLRKRKQFKRWREALAEASHVTGIPNRPANNKKGTPLCAHHCRTLVLLLFACVNSIIFVRILFNSINELSNQLVNID